MNAEVVKLQGAPSAPSLQNRVSGIAVLVGALAIVAWGGLVAVRAFTDAWVAPIFLSPDNDSVIQLRLSLNRQVAELDQAAADQKADLRIVSRLDDAADLAAEIGARQLDLHHADSARQRRRRLFLLGTADQPPDQAAEQGWQDDMPRQHKLPASEKTPHRPLPCFKHGSVWPGPGLLLLRRSGSSPTSSGTGRSHPACRADNPAPAPLPCTPAAAIP